MRKWMRERLKRRKKTQDEPSGAEAKKAPLQPAYFESENPAAQPAVPRSEEPVHAKPEEAAPVAPETDDAVSPPPQTRGSPEQGRRPGTADGGRGRRRRRGRGGRGRSSARSTARAATPQPDLSQAEITEPLQRATELPETDTQAAPEVLPLTPQAPAKASAPHEHPSKGVVVLAIGLPGSGKSSWFKRHNITPLSSDLLRALLFDDAQEQRFQDLVFSNLRSMLKARLIARRPTNYVDATNLSPHERHSWIKLARDFGYDVHAVFFDVPLQVCLERNRRRQRVVKEDVMQRMASKLKAPTFEEGFSKITVVRVKQKE